MEEPGRPAAHSCPHQDGLTSTRLRTPANVLRRIQVESRAELDKEKPEDRYFVHAGVTLRLEDLVAFSRSLHKVFIETPEVSKTIGELANFDVRRTLELVRNSVSSPHLAVSDLITAHVAGTTQSIVRWKIDRSIIRQHYDIYPTGQHNFVQNVFSLDSGLTTTPLLGLRLLRLLGDVPFKEHEGKITNVDEVTAYCSGMGVEPRATSLWLDVMLKTGLILAWDPSIESISATTKVEISPSGERHLKWGNESIEYISSMAVVTPVLRHSTYTELREAKGSLAWKRRTRTFVDYLLEEDSLYCTLPDHSGYESQERIAKVLGSIRDRFK